MPTNGIRRQREHDRDCRGYLLCGEGRASYCENNIDLEPDKLRRDFG